MLSQRKEINYNDSSEWVKIALVKTGLSSTVISVNNIRANRLKKHASTYLKAIELTKQARELFKEGKTCQSQIRPS